MNSVHPAQINRTPRCVCSVRKVDARFAAKRCAKAESMETLGEKYVVVVEAVATPRRVVTAAFEARWSLRNSQRGAAEPAPMRKAVAASRAC
eukprot:g2772.t1